MAPVSVEVKIHMAYAVELSVCAATVAMHRLLSAYLVSKVYQFETVSRVQSLKVGRARWNAFDWGESGANAELSGAGTTLTGW